MLTTGITQVLALLFGLLVYAMARTQLARRQAGAEKGVSTGSERAQ